MVGELAGRRAWGGAWYPACSDFLRSSRFGFFPIPHCPITKPHPRLKYDRCNRPTIDICD